ncbi:MAG: MarR family transcriptional regulator [Flavobacteriales bacterium]|nr:MarR family transcriptional regulator [Flavobacteriales bacterium]
MARIEDELVSRFESEQHKALLNVLFTANWFKAQHLHALAPDGISMQQYNILRILRGARGKRMSMHQVKARMIERSPNATRLTDKLIARALVHRDRCEEDRRVVHVSITPAGMDLLARLDRRIRPLLKELEERISEVEAGAVNVALDKLRG